MYNLVSLQDYIDKIKNDNIEQKNTDARINFFYNKKLNKLMLRKRSVVCNNTSVKTSTSTIRPITIIDSSLKKYSLSKLTLTEKEDFVMSNLDKLFCFNQPSDAVADMETSIIDSEETGDQVIYLDNLDVDKIYRNCGLASTLIDELKSTCLNTNLLNVRGTLLPLDKEGFVYSNIKGYTPLFNKLLNYFSYKTGLLKSHAFVDRETLTSIYTKLGFLIDSKESLVENEKTLILNVNENSITPEKRLPVEFTNYEKNKKTLILHT